MLRIRSTRQYIHVNTGKRTYKVPRNNDVEGLGRIFLDPYTVAETPDGRIVVVAMPAETEEYEQTPRSIYYMVIDLDKLEKKGLDKAILDMKSLSSDPVEALKKYMGVLRRLGVTPRRELIDMYETVHSIPRTKRFTALPSRTLLEYSMMFNRSGHRYGVEEGLLSAVRDALKIMTGTPLLKDELFRVEDGITWVVVPGAKAPFLGTSDYLDSIEKLGSLEPLELSGYKRKGYNAIVKALRERGRELGGWGGIVSKWVQLVGTPVKAYLLRTNRKDLYPEYLVVVGRNGKVLLVKTWKMINT